MIAEELILLYVPMPLNADGDGPADPDETVRVEHQLWDADTNTTVFTARDEASALQLVQAWNHPAPIKPSADTGELRERIVSVVKNAVRDFEDDMNEDWKTAMTNAAGKAADAILDLIQTERAGSPIGQNDQPGLAVSDAGKLREPVKSA